MQDAPFNTHLLYHVLISYLSMNAHLIGDFALNQWGMHADGFVYISLPDQGQVNRPHRGQPPPNR